MMTTTYFPNPHAQGLTRGYGWSPNGESYDTWRHNALLTMAELMHWARQPSQFAAYAGRDGQITLWTGDVIGRYTITGSYRSGFGWQKRTPIYVWGDNGARYHAVVTHTKTLVLLRRYRGRAGRVGPA